MHRQSVQAGKDKQPQNKDENINRIQNELESLTSNTEECIT